MATARPAFTLVELVLYIGLSIVVVAAMLNVVITLGGTRGKEGARIELQQQLRLAGERITGTVRHAQQIEVASSVFGSASGVLALTLSGSVSPTVVSLSGGSVYIQDGAYAGRITTNDVRIAELRFTNLTASGTDGTVRFSLWGYINDPRYPDTLEFRSAVSLRQ